MMCVHGLSLFLSVMDTTRDGQPTTADFALALADGTTVTGPFEGLGDQWSVRLRGATPRQAAGVDILTLRRAQTRRPAFPTGEQIIFANSDRLPGKLLKLAGEKLH